ncbi:hypothetical protein CYG48_12710 [Neorhizobium sp. SOG26]|uniref:hypothetical protein n=1 Tax=Neorhizobium sp. SOG26 TaxID=2060726 RepID=UPI000E56AF6B|nr:hypothetical protein [Neorhizobium sp. SOG26]AXV16472.1 hypothetical protein CYG48_12710 [Neorhizobium sp. SOG26]
MPVCAECGDTIEEDLELDTSDVPAVERLYRAVADGEPQREIMQMIYDLFGDRCQLRSPVAELNLARRCASGSDARA